MHDHVGRLQKKIVIVTGAFEGVGEAIARRVCDEAATVIAAGDATEVRTLADGDLVPVHVDVAAPQSAAELVAAVVAKYGRLNAMINCAEIVREFAFLDTPVEEFDAIVERNLRGTFVMGQAASRAMQRSGGGSIVNVAGVSGLTYGASKGGVVMLSEAMATDLAPFGIRVNVIAPGPVESPLAERTPSPHARKRWTYATPLERYARPDEIAGAAVFFCSTDASFITGQVLAIDGGFLASGLTARPDVR